MADLVPYSQAATTSLVSTLQNSDLMALAREDNQSDTGYRSKVTRVDTVAKKVVKETDYSDLQTTSKNPIGAINEVNAKASRFDNMTATASGSIASFTDGGDDIPVSEYECEIVAQQASGTPTPDNPLPITGFSACDIGVDANYGGFVEFNQLLQNGNFTSTTGWSISNATNFATLNNILSYVQTITGTVANPVATDCNTLTDHVYLLTVDIKSISSAINARIRQPIITNPKTIPLNEWTVFSEIFKCTEDNTTIAIQLDCITDNEINLQNFMFIDLTQMFGISKAEEILTMEQQVSGSGVAFVKNLLYKDYYDYDVGTVGTIGEINNDGTGNTYIVEFGQTIYGGRLIYKDGQWSIEATHGYVDLGTLYWNYDNANVRFYSTTLENLAKLPASYSEKMNGISDIFNVDSAENWNVNYTITLFPNGVLTAKDTDYTDVTTFINAISNHYLVYELATPVIIPITSSTRVKTISGINNIFSNTGDNSVKYFTENADEIAELIKAFVL